MSPRKTLKSISGQLVPISSVQTALIKEIRTLIEKARINVAITVNSEMTLLYWHIGKRINDEILKGKRAEYGKQIVASLAEQLTAEYGKGWSEKQLRHCLRAAETFTDEAIFSTVRRELSWTHIKTLMYLDSPLKRDFYIEMARLEGWSLRQLQERINSQLYERTAISKKPEKTIRNDLLAMRQGGRFSPDLAFRDPYLLDFLGLADTYAEKDLEAAVVAELQRFIIELGSDFAFPARQKRITIDHRDYYIDLLFYHRRLKCMVVIDLKIGEFEAAFKGQMELYLRYLKKHEQLEGENSPIGLILCTGKNDEHIELLKLDKSNIRVADYLTLLPSKELLKAKLHRSIEIARNRLAMEASE